MCAILIVGDAMNKKGFAISIILYSMVFLLITTLYIILGVFKTRYTVTNELRDSIVEELSATPPPHALTDGTIQLLADSNGGQYNCTGGSFNIYQLGYGEYEN